jgi:RNA polymerase sigma factor (sigma-70 family)
MKSDRHDAFLQPLQAHRGILYKVANAYCARREDRGDLIQDIIVELWRAWPRFDGRAAFSTWMYRIAVNVAISSHRGMTRRVNDAAPLDDLGFDLAAADAAMTDEGDDMHALHQLIARLDDLDRALVLLFLEGYDHEQIGQMLGLGTSNVATRFNRIKQRMQRDHAAASAETTP